MPRFAALTAGLCLAAGLTGACGGRGEQFFELDEELAPGSPASPSAGSGEASDASEEQPASTAAETDGNSFAGTGCLGGDTACSNCVDDDGDGLIDAFDPECTGPLDDDERTFATGIPGDNRDFCQDCFFDGNSGHGDDGCQYHTDCLYGETPTGGSGSGCFSCDVSNACVSGCLELTPNGCDCFGCCQVPGFSDEHHVLLSETCTIDQLDDSEACQPCVPSDDCNNDCGPCEICIGKVTVSPECGEPDAPPACPEGRAACAPDAPCAAGEYCLTGCCTDAFVIR